MTATTWIKMNREQARRVLGHLAQRPDAVVFSRDVTEVSWRGLAFYANWRLCRLTNYATMPTFTMTYLTDGTDYIALDGTANPIYTVNEKDPLMLKEDSILPYLEFFFSNVQGSEGDVFLIRDPHKMPFMDRFNPVQQENIIDSFKPAAVVFDGDLNAYRVSGTLHYGSVLLAAAIVVLPDGKISFEEQHLLLSGIFFPDSPYTPAWVEGLR